MAFILTFVFKCIFMLRLIFVFIIVFIFIFILRLIDMYTFVYYVSLKYHLCITFVFEGYLCLPQKLGKWSHWRFVSIYWRSLDLGYIMSCWAIELTSTVYPNIMCQEKSPSRTIVPKKILWFATDLSHSIGVTGCDRYILSLRRRPNSLAYHDDLYGGSLLWRKTRRQIEDLQLYFPKNLLWKGSN